MSPYAKNFIQTHSLPLSVKENKFFSLKVFKKPFVLNVVLLSFILLLIIFQFILVNRMVVYSFKRNELEEEKRMLEQEKRNLELEIIKIKSTEGTKDSFKNFNLVQVEEIEYLKPISGTMAEK
ncbi:MAG: hypothetical protein N2259_02395 [Patescibacteria group bacterium]|nr:hypothetical protein [Patescibacteria group bacterium]